MATKGKREFILLSELILKLDNNDYYLTYAKSLALTEKISKTPLPENKLIREMFNYFILTDELSIYRNETNTLTDTQAQQTNPTTANNYRLIQNPKIEDIQYSNTFIKIKDLKKLYANKCIVFPSSLLN